MSLWGEADALPLPSSDVAEPGSALECRAGVV